jgi:hypothetical protein
MAGLSRISDTSIQPSRQALASREYVLAAMVAVASIATRSLAIMTQNLESDIYDRADFVGAVKHLCLSRSYARIRVVVTNPRRTLRDGNRFVYLGRRLSSFIEFRHAGEQHRNIREAYMIADQSGLVYRADGDRWEGIVDTSEPLLARQYLETFDEIWAAAAPANEFGQLHL